MRGPSSMTSAIRSTVFGVPHRCSAMVGTLSDTRTMTGSWAGGTGRVVDVVVTGGGCVVGWGTGGGGWIAVLVVTRGRVVVGVGSSGLGLGSALGLGVGVGIRLGVGVTVGGLVGRAAITVPSPHPSGWF